MEELQALWHKASAKEETRVSQEELESLVSHTSSDELNRFRQVLFIEYVGSWLLIPILVFGMFRMPGYQPLAVSLMVISVYLIYFYRKALRQFDLIHHEDNIQTYLQRALDFLKTYVRHYKILCWVAGGVGGVIGYYTKEEEEFHLAASPAWDLVFAVGLVVVAILFTHFYIKYLYQARIDKLEQLLQEFSEK